MNISAWRTGDPEWLGLRRKQWPEFLEYVKSHFNEVAHPDEYLRRAEEYYFSGTLEGDYRDRVDCLPVWDYYAMHPSLDVVAAREIIVFHDRVESAARGHFGFHYGAPKWFYPLFEKNLLDPKIGGVVIRAFYGEDYLTAAALRGFDPTLTALSACDALLKEFSFWLSPPVGYEWFPVRQLIPVAIGALEFYSAEDIERGDFQLRKLAKRFARLDETTSKQFPELQEFAEGFQRVLEGSNAAEEIKLIFR